MWEKDGEASPFRKAYIGEILETIRKNVRSEFHLLWEEHERTSKPFTLLTNSISKRINTITDAIASSKLPENPRLCRHVVEQYVPQSLKDLIGLDEILKTVPENYLRWMIASTMATHFVYQNGLETDEVAFHNYVSSLL